MESSEGWIGLAAEGLREMLPGTWRSLEGSVVVAVVVVLVLLRGLGMGERSSSSRSERSSRIRPRRPLDVDVRDMERRVRSASERTWRGLVGEGEVVAMVARICSARGEADGDGGLGGGIAE